MSKNISRKGIAFGALVALGSSLIAVAPAHAANELVFEPTAGTTYNTLLGDDFALAASLAPGQVAGNVTQLKYLLEGTAGTLAYQVTTGGVAEPDVVSVATASTVIKPVDLAPTSSNILAIRLNTAAVTANVTKSAIVTAFIDSDNDDIVDSGEFQQARTINFVKHSEVTPVVTFNTPLAGDTELVSSVNLGNINVAQLGTALKVQYAATTGAITDALVGGVLADADGLFKDAVTGVDAAEVISAQVKFGAASVGSPVSKTVTAATIQAPTASVVAGANATAAGAARLDSAFQIAATVRSSATGNPLAAGENLKAKIEFTGVALSATRTITINGTVYNGSTALPLALPVTSDSKGVAAVNISTSGLTLGNKVKVTFSAQNLAPAVAEATLAPALFTAASSQVSVGVLRSIANGGSTTLSYEVKDQFGQLVTVPARLAFTVTGNASAAVTSYVNLVGGKASVQVSDTVADLSTSYTVAAEPQLLEADGNYRVGTSASAAVQTVNVTDTAIAWAAGALNGDGTVKAPAATPISTAVALNAAVVVNNPGAAVTVASKGATFVFAGVEYSDSITLNSGAAGVLTGLTVKSDIAGDHTITYTAGSDVRTGKFTVNPAAENAATTITLTAPAKVLPGGVLVVSGQLTDKFGNPVDTNQAASETRGTAATFSVAYTDNGQGVIIGSLPVLTGTDGKFTLRYSIAANQSGTAVVTVKYDADGVGATAELTASKTVIINKSSTASASAGSKKITVRAKNSLGETVKVYVDGVLKSTKVATSNNYAITVSGLTAGKHNVKVLVSGRSVFSTRIEVKK